MASNPTAHAATGAASSPPPNGNGALASRLTRLRTWLKTNTIIFYIWTLFNVCVGAGAYIWGGSDVHGAGLKIVLAVSIAIEIGAGVLASERTELPPPESSTARDDASALARLSNPHFRQYSNYSATASLICKQSDHRLRTIDKLTLTPALIQRYITSTWRYPDSDVDRTVGKHVVVPITEALKGTLVNDLEVTGSSGELLPVLPFNIAQRVVVETWRRIIATYEPSLEGVGSEGAKLLGRTAFRSGLRVIISTLPRELRRSSTLLQVRSEQHVADWERLNPQIAQLDEEAGGLARAFLKQFSNHYMIGCLLTGDDPGGHFVTTQSYSMNYLDPFDLPNSRASRTAKMLRRFGFSAPPAVVDLSLRLAMVSRSYHLYVSLPKGNHIAQATIMHANGTPFQRVRLGRFVGNQPYFHRSRLGFRKLHLYTRGFKRAPKDLSLQVRVNEPPWGILGSALVASVLSTSVLWLIYRWPQADASSVLVAAVGLPLAALSALFAYRPPRRRGKLTYSIAGSALYLATAFLLALGVLCEILQHPIESSETDHSELPHWINTDALLQVARLSLTVTLVALGVFITRAISWYFHKREENS